MHNYLFYVVALLSWCSNLVMVHANNDGCNELVCGSVVSMCLLTQRCQCKLADSHCCKDCLNCMGDLYTECCDCLDMCPQHNETLSALAPKSQIGDFDGIPEYFDILTAEDDDEKWTTLRFPMRAGLKPFGSGGSDGASDAIDRHAFQLNSVNCTVIYLNECITSEKCATNCEEMGANRYRWFHDGCCECVGANCVNYGINESRCSSCPQEDEDQLDDMTELDYHGDKDDDQMMLDYGEDEINYN